MCLSNENEASFFICQSSCLLFNFFTSSIPRSCACAGHGKVYATPGGQVLARYAPRALVPLCSTYCCLMLPWKYLNKREFSSLTLMFRVQSVVCILGMHTFVKHQWRLVGEGLLRLSANIRLVFDRKSFCHRPRPRVPRDSGLSQTSFRSSLRMSPVTIALLRLYARRGTVI